MKARSVCKQCTAFYEYEIGPVPAPEPHDTCFACLWDRAKDGIEEQDRTIEYLERRCAELAYTQDAIRKERDDARLELQTLQQRVGLLLGRLFNEQKEGLSD